jgi:Domain of unknown function (DUF4157)
MVGRPLDAETQAFFDSRFGYNFSNVQIHTDSAAQRSARQVGALAYTSGNSIVFAKGRFEPHTYEGKRLLAHELAHVIQQNERPMHSAQPVIQRAPAEPVEDRLQNLHRAIEAKGAPAAPESPSQDFGAWLLILVDQLIELKAQGDPGGDALRADIRITLNSVADSRAWKLFGYDMAIADELSIALMEAGMPVEGLRLWDSARPGIVPAERAHAEIDFASRILQEMPVPSADQPRAALKYLTGLQLLYVATVREMDASNIGPGGQPERVAAVKSQLLEWFPSLVLQYQIVLWSIIDGRLDDSSSVLDSLASFLPEISQASSLIESEEIEITLSEFGARPMHQDVLEPGNAARQMPFEFYTEESKQEAHELKRSVAGILELLGDQIALLKVAERTRSGPEAVHPFKDDDSLRAWVLHLLKTPDSADDTRRPLERVIYYLKQYFERFTTHSDYNLSDMNVRYINKPFPRALTGELVQDCGIYAMRIAYILSLAAKELDLRFYWIKLPVHMALAIADRERILYIVHNGMFISVGNDELAKPRPEVIGSLAASTFVPQADLDQPDTRVEEADIIGVPYRVTRISNLNEAALIDAYAAQSVKPLPVFERQGFEASAYLGVIETYRAFAREAPLRFLPAAIEIYDRLIADLTAVEQSSLDDTHRAAESSLIVAAAHQSLNDAYKRYAMADAEAYLVELAALRERLRLAPESVRKRGDWAVLKTLQDHVVLPDWYVVHLDFVRQFITGYSAQPPLSPLQSPEHPYRLAFKNLAD